MCSDLSQNLGQTQRVLALFQQRVLGTPQEEQPESERYLRQSYEGLLFSHFSFLSRVIPSATELDIAAILTHSLRQDSSAPTSRPAQLGITHQSTGSALNPTVGDDDSPECCGGLIDWESLIEYTSAVDGQMMAPNVV